MHSEQISAFLKFLQQVRSDYTYCYEQVGQADKLTQDLLHDLEPEELGYRERAKIATRLRQARRDRRENKDMVEVTGKFLAVIDQPQVAKVIESFKQMLGEVRKVEQYHVNRTYKRRIM